MKPPVARPEPREVPPPVNPRAQERDRELIDADRLMMQMVQTSISLIGFGFTINAFFNDVADSSRTARRLGLVLLCLGLLFLAMGIYNQARLRLRIRARYPDIGLGNVEDRLHGYSAAPSFVLAISLLVAGLWALLSILTGMTPA